MICGFCEDDKHRRCDRYEMNCACRARGHTATHALARRTDPETSHEAAASVDATKREAAVRAGMLDLGGSATTKEIARHLGIPRDSVSPRMRPLTKKGFVRKTGARRDGAEVYELTRL